jgi:hypothetical protein
MSRLPGTIRPPKRRKTARYAPLQNPNFRDPGHPQSGSCTDFDFLFSRNGVLYEPGLGSADALFDAKLLEDFV